MTFSFSDSISRRRFIVFAGAGLLTVGPGAHIDVLAQDQSDTSSDFDETFESIEDMFVVEWDSEEWIEYQLLGAQVPEGYSVRLKDIGFAESGDMGTRLSVSYQDIGWGASGRDLQEAIDSWFNLGMLEAVIVHTWEESEEMGFIFTSGKSGNRTIMYFAYKPIEGEPDRRLWTTLTIDQPMYDHDEMHELLESVSINSNSISTELTNAEIMQIFETNLD